MPRAPFPFTLIDLTHTLSPGIPTWNEPRGFEIVTETFPGDGPDAVDFNVQSIQMCAGIGTHLDAPSHCLAGQVGSSVADLPLEHLVAPCVVMDVTAQSHAQYRVTPDDILAWEHQHGTIQPGSFVIIHTGWGTYFGDATRYHNGHVFPSLEAGTAELLHQRAIVGLGIDTLSPDVPAHGFHTHRILLSAGIYLVENVANAQLMPTTGAYVMVMPLKIAGGTEAPVRMIGLVPRT